MKYRVNGVEETLPAHGLVDSEAQTTLIGPFCQKYHSIVYLKSWPFVWPLLQSKSGLSPFWQSGNPAFQSHYSDINHQ